MKSFIHYLKLISTRIIILYLIGYGIIHICLDAKASQRTANLLALNRIRPESFNYLVKLSKEQVEPDADSIDGFVHYYEKVLQFVGHRADGYGLLAYSLCQKGEKKKCVEAYKRAIKENATFFWYYHNLGVVYYQDGRYKEAFDILSQGVVLPPEATFTYIGTSQRLYVPLLSMDSEDIRPKLISEYRLGHKDSYLMMVQSAYGLKDYKEGLQLAIRAIENQLDQRGEFYFYAGLASHELKDYPKAVYFFKESMKRDEKNHEVVYHLALSIQAAGKAQMAQKIIQKSEGLKRLSGSTAYSDQNFALKLY